MELSLTSLFEKFTRNGMLIRVLAASIMLLTAGCLTFNQEKIQKHQSITEIENNNTLNSNGMCVVAFKKNEKYAWSIIVRMDGSYAKKDSLSMKEEILGIFSRFPLCSTLYIHDPKSAFCECWSFDPDGLLTHFSSRLYIRNFKVLYSAKSIDALAARNREVHKKELLHAHELLLSSPYWIPIHGDTLTDGGSRILTLINDVGQIIHIQTTVEYPSSGREVYILEKNYSGPDPIRVIPGTELAETLNEILHNIDTEVRGGDISIDLEVLHSLLDRK